YNKLMRNRISAGIFKKIMGISPDRQIPAIAPKSLIKWYEQDFSKRKNPGGDRGEVLFFCDEFTNYQDVETGKKAIMLLDRLGYSVIIPKHRESGRTWLSKGFLREAKKVIDENIQLLSDRVTDEIPIVGVEPSAILSFRDEYLTLCDESLIDKAEKLSGNALMIEEFILREYKAGKISKGSFTKEEVNIKLHGHCHQKALSSVTPVKQILMIPENYSVQMIPSGCCGMAGSFGYEKEHYEVSMKIGELVLFPAVRKASPETIIAAPGTSCRHQIKDGTGRISRHPIEILHHALII
ncbi:MAG: FAD-binding oxidoreductase, partial [Cyclobacteriaceae bacterium]